MLLYVKACNNNLASACNNLGYLYYKGYGVEKDFKKAQNYYSKACKLDEAVGCYNLAKQYESGSGVIKYGLFVERFYQRGCKLGNKSSCAMLNDYQVDDDSCCSDYFESQEVNHIEQNDYKAISL